jgi:hypothetical protein
MKNKQVIFFEEGGFSTAENVFFHELKILGPLSINAFFNDKCLIIGLIIKHLCVLGDPSVFSSNSFDYVGICFIFFNKSKAEGAP